MLTKAIEEFQMSKNSNFLISTAIVVPITGSPFTLQQYHDACEIVVTKRRIDKKKTAKLIAIKTKDERSKKKRDTKAANKDSKDKIAAKLRD